MLLILAVSLYTSRIILEVLGVEDYGTYNLIAGFVTFLVFISNSLVSAMQRYFNVSLGEKNFQRYKEVFSMSLNILFLFSLLIIIIGETIGFWFVKNHLNIPESRFSIAMWVYQISLITFIANTLRTPFHASIIAHEKMSFYAYISVAEAVLRLAMVFLLTITPMDRLLLYSVLYLSITIVVDLIYVFYCKYNFKECQYTFKKDNKLFRELLCFSGWAFVGQSAIVIKGQGEAILINRFFSVVTNAAMGIAQQVTNAIEMFVNNFQVAFTPQIIQSYASKEIKEHHKLLLETSKLSYYLLLVLTLPIIFNIQGILSLWLYEVPEYTDKFVMFILISYLFNALGSPLTKSIFASGNIKQYQIALSVVFLLGLFITYVAFQLGCKPYSASKVAVLTQITLLFFRLYYCKKETGFNLWDFFKSVLLPIFKTTIIILIFSFLTSPYLKDNLFISVFTSFTATSMIIFCLGLNSEERTLLKKILKRKKNVS